MPIEKTPSNPYSDPGHVFSMTVEGIMRKFVCLAVLITISAGMTMAPAMAQDQLGLYFDEAGSLTEFTTSAPYTTVPAWVLLRDPSTVDDITAYEFRLEYVTDGPDPILVWQLPPQALNVLEEPAFMVGLGTPLSPMPLTTLAQVQIIVPEAGQTIWFTLHPVAQPSLLDPPGFGYPVCHPAYAAGNSNEGFIAMPPVSGCESDPVAVINSDNQPPTFQLSDMPNQLVIDDLYNGQPFQILMLDNLGPVSVTGTVRSTGTTPVRFQIDYGYLSLDPLTFQVPVGGHTRINAEYPEGPPFVDSNLIVEICGETYNIPVLVSSTVCGLEPETVEFDQTFVNDIAYEAVTLTNTGSAAFELDNEYSAGPFSFYCYTPYGGLQPGDSRSGHVRFHPTQEGYFEETIEIGDGFCSLTVSGTAYDPPPQCQVEPDRVNFKDIVVGSHPSYQRIRITNVGGGILEGVATLADTTGAFYWGLYPSLRHFSLGRNQSRVLYLYFDPLEEGRYSNQVSLGVECGLVPVSGNAIDLDPECDVYGYYLQDDVLTMRSIPVGGVRNEYLRIRNIGGGLLEGSISLEDTTGTFQLAYGIDYSLGFQESQTVYIQFTPPSVGTFSTVLHLGSDCGDITITAEGLESYPDCYAYSYNNHIDRVAVGDTSLAYVYILNSGYQDLTGELSVEGEGFEVVNPGPFDLPVGGYRYEMLRFVPPAVGTFSAMVSTGLDLCPGNWEFTGRGVPEGSDRMGYYVDAEGTDNNLTTDAPNQQVTAYLVLHQPSAEGPLTRWYVNHWPSGSVTLLPEWTYPVAGEAYEYSYNHRFYPEVPMPLTSTMVLAEIPLIVESPGEASMLNMGYASYNFETDEYPNWVRIQRPGSLFFNGNKSFLDNRLPAPEVLVDQGGVHLVWPVSHDNFEGYHVYRWLEGLPPEKLTEEPILGKDGEATFTDSLLPPGEALVKYHITALHFGEESLPGKEAEVRVAAVMEMSSPPPAHTRLLAPYPNPFNPETHLPFELARPGRVQIKIYDIAGRLVRTLVDGHFEAGSFEEIWNGRDDAGRTLPSNVYYAKLWAGQVAQLKKMTLLK